MRKDLRTGQPGLPARALIGVCIVSVGPFVLAACSSSKSKAAAPAASSTTTAVAASTTTSTAATARTTTTTAGPTTTSAAQGGGGSRTDGSTKAGPCTLRQLTVSAEPGPWAMEGLIAETSEAIGFANHGSACTLHGYPAVTFSGYTIDPETPGCSATPPCSTYPISVVHSSPGSACPAVWGSVPKTVSLPTGGRAVSYLRYVDLDPTTGLTEEIQGMRIGVPASASTVSVPVPLAINGMSETPLVSPILASSVSVPPPPTCG